MRSLLILGGGVAGLAAAETAADAGARVLLLERAPVVGGKRGARLESDAGADAWPADAGPRPSVEALRRAPRVECLTLAELVGVEADDERFAVEIQTSPRYVTADCTRCGQCLAVCPETGPNDAEAGLTLRRAIHGYYPDSLPHAFAIDVASCLNDPPNYLPCSRCSDVCDDDAIDFLRARKETRRETVDAILLATGYDDRRGAARDDLADFGYGRHGDVVSMVELQRMLEAPGPSGGFVVRPSDEEYASDLLLVLPQATAFTRWVLENQLRALAEQDVAVRGVLLLEPPSDDERLTPLHALLRARGLTLTFATWLGAEARDGGGIESAFVDLTSGRTVRLAADLLLLGTDISPHVPPARLPLETDADGWLVLDEDGRTALPGIWAVGGAAGPYGIADGVVQARRVAAEAAREVEAPSPEAVSGWQAMTGEDRRTLLENLLHGLLARARR